MANGEVETSSIMEDTKLRADSTSTMGVTFSGTTFTVPQTFDMVKTLFDPTVRKSNSEKVILLLLASNFMIFWLVDKSITRIRIFISLYIFWRLSYNFGIGYLLHSQSKEQKMLSWVKKYGVFNDKSGVGKLCINEIRSQMGNSYRIDDYPVEFNTWLLFRKVVDLILMSDFTAFICLVIACSIDKDYQFINTSQQAVWIVGARLFIGTILILFNLWVKVNAHNTIKDYAWYWGDFFFRQINNEELIFDGVFEMVPHPMYSVGYVGYYGLALIAKSYTVLCISIFGHFLQMIFLHYIENPHIDKIYGPSNSEIDNEKLLKLKDLKNFDNSKPLVGLCNFLFFRASDILSLIIVISYSLIFPLIAYFTSGSKLGANSKGGCILFALVIVTKLLESILIDVLLILQSYYKTFTKMCVSNNMPIEKSLSNWSVLYNSMINITYSSYFGLNMYYLLGGVDQSSLFILNWFYLRVFLCFLLILTQVWINASIIDSIGYFGWFYGDFFIPKSNRRSHLTKAGIYRYLNNPEQVFGVCGVMGITLLIPNKENTICCLLWVANNFIRINCIEKPHMIQLYGENEVLVDSGVTKTFKKHLVPDIIKSRVSTSEPSSEKHKKKGRRSSLVSSAVDSLDGIIKEFRKYNKDMSKQNFIELSQQLYFQDSECKVTIENLETSEQDPIKFIYLGDSIKVNWDCLKDHSSNDWIGLYKISQTSYSRHRTLKSSSGRWIWATEAHGSSIFSDDLLFWEEGIFEFRYHRNGKHDVAYITQPFMIKARSIEIPDTLEDSISFASALKLSVFDKVTDRIDDINASIPLALEHTNNILQVYERLACMLSLGTGIKLNSKSFLYSDSDEDLTILKLSTKIIKIQRFLDELSYNS